MQKSIILVLLLAFGVAACGTYTLGNVHPQSGKTTDQQQLDTLTCKDQANLAANTAGRQTGDFLLGLTIVGAPVAFEREKAKEREVFADCMTARGYVVTPADGAASTPKAAAGTGAEPVQPVPGVDQLTFALPTGFELKAIPDNLKNSGAVFYAINHTLDMGLAVIPLRHEGITDLAAYASTKKAGQMDRLKDATSSEVTRIDVRGHPAARYSVTGTFGGVKVTFLTTLIEGHDQIVIVNGWAGATNAQQQMAVLEGLADTVSGIL